LPATILPATPTPEDLAPTEDVQITQAIRDLATSLGNAPVPIYNWVRNNIAFIPSYGSIQGADMTLQTKRGNAFDTASLLIALLRAANVPARYVYGTIEVPIERAMNWVGGVTVPEAALNLMGQGGIPNLGIAQGGQVKWIDLEHVWVEAYVDYTPSRGAVNRNPNTWVPLDASFKQYQFTQGMDVKSNVPFDAQSFITQIQQGATVNTAEGWVQNVNQTLIQSTLTNYQTQVANYVNAQKANATVGDVLGTQAIVQENRPILLGTLPYKRIATGAKFQVIPDNLRWRFRYNVYANDVDRANDTPMMSLNQSTPSLAGKKITLSFTPATPADLDVINSYLPQPHPDGTPILPSELPTSLPGYLIKLAPELRLEGQIVATGPAFTMGSELVQASATYNAGTRQWEAADDNRPTVGEYIATFLDLQGVSQAQVGALKTRIDATRTTVNSFIQNPTDQTQIQALTKEELTGDLMHVGVFTYFAAIDAGAILNARNNGVVTYRMPSFGNFGIVAQAHFTFGVPRTVLFPSVQMDIDRIAGNEFAKAGDNATVVSFRRAVGTQYSAHEHLIPERLFTDPNDPNRPQGISAVQALAIAASQGQKIYTLNGQNQATHSLVLTGLGIDQAVKDELANALALGREITIHQSNINAFGFTGVGYIILDPDTGAAAYKISGGANGGNLSGIASAATGLMVISLLAGNLIAAKLIPAFTIAAPYYALAFALIAVSIVVVEIATGGVDMTCGGQPTCNQVEIITKITAGTVAMVLLNAGLGGNLIALVLAILLLKNIFSGR
ncbi:MAG: transglutaminase domain-containing protein, partial [Betaproteobacteria bacterium]|nr:transglutaminase domain-containing protein [Betaproteobacteria bacterium]